MKFVWESISHGIHGFSSFRHFTMVSELQLRAKQKKQRRSSISCSLCEPSSGPLVDENVTVYNIKKSARNGCDRCKWLMTALFTFRPQLALRSSSGWAPLRTANSLLIQVQQSQSSSMPSLPCESHPSKPAHIKVRIKGSYSVFFGFEFFTANGEIVNP